MPPEIKKLSVVSNDFVKIDSAEKSVFYKIVTKDKINGTFFDL